MINAKTKSEMEKIYLNATLKCDVEEEKIKRKIVQGKKWFLFYCTQKVKKIKALVVVLIDNKDEIKERTGKKNWINANDKIAT